MKLSGIVTAENDPDHLLGRPNEYTSKVTFSDTRISKADASGQEKGAVEQGGAIEAFANSTDVKARKDYIQTIIKSFQALAEYDYVYDSVLVRVSQYLTPTQSAAYKTAAASLG